MHGNVWEWCNDGYDNYQVEDQTDPTGLDSGSRRIIRGGSWNSSARECRSAHRDSRDPDSSDSEIGFRLIWTPSAAQPESSNLLAMKENPKTK